MVKIKGTRQDFEEVKAVLIEKGIITDEEIKNKKKELKQKQ